MPLPRFRRPGSNGHRVSFNEPPAPLFANGYPLSVFQVDPPDQQLEPSHAQNGMHDDMHQHPPPFSSVAPAPAFGADVSPTEPVHPSSFSTDDWRRSSSSAHHDAKPELAEWGSYSQHKSNSMVDTASLYYSNSIKAAPSTSETVERPSVWSKASMPIQHTTLDPEQEVPCESSRTASTNAQRMSIVPEEEDLVDTIDRYAGPPKTYGDLSRVDSDDREKIFREDGLRVGIKQRHSILTTLFLCSVQMVALTGTLGTGLWLGIAKILAQAGPLFLLLGFIGSGVVCALTVLSLGEVTVLAPVTGAYARHTLLFTSDSFGFATGWNLVYYNSIACAAEVSSCAILAQYWTNLNGAIFVSIFMVTIILTNIVVVRAWAEIEFLLALIKLVMVLGIIILSICIDLGAGPQGHRLGFHFWKNPGPINTYLIGGDAGRLFSIWNAAIAAIYSYANCEAIAMLVAETRNPRRTMRKATQRTFIRIFACYVTICICAGLIVGYNDPHLLGDQGTATQSPFVIATTRVGIKALPSIIVALIIVSAWSAADSLILNGSRSLISLAQDGNAPQCFTKVHRWGVPYIAVGFVCIWSALSYMVVNQSATKVFNWFVALASTSALWTWTMCNVNFLRLYYALKAQNIPRSSLPWATPFQPYGAWFALAGCVFLIVTGGFTIFVPHHFEAEKLVTAYASPALNIAATVGHEVYAFFKQLKQENWDWSLIKDWTFFVPLDEVPVQPWLAQNESNPEPPEKPQKGWKRMFTWLWD